MAENLTSATMTAKRVLLALAVVLAAYLIVRAVMEPFVIDMSDPTSYRDDWGGPSLAGVLAVHCGPGVVSAALLLTWQARRRKTHPLPSHS